MSNLSDYKLTISTGDNVSLTGNISANNITVSTDLLVQGDLNVTGTQTITNTTTLAVNDNKVTLNSGASGTPTLNAGVVIDRGSSSDVDLRWNESTDKWEQTRDGSTYVNIPISTTELSEGTNQYFTNARARAAISVTGSGSYDSGTGVITVTGGVTSVNTLTGAVTLSTTNIAEGTNLYYTDSRANTAFDARLAVKSTSNLSEGTNLYYTNARANSAMAAFTGNLTAGNASLGNLTTSNYFAGVLTTAAQPNITSVGTLTSLISGTHTVSANANIAMSGSLSQISGGNLVSASYLTGTLTTAAQPNITSTGTLTSLTVTGNVTGGNIVSGGVANITGNITGANLIAGSSGQGNVYAGNVIVNGQPTTYGVVTPAYIVVGLASSIASFGLGSTVIFDTVVGNANSQTSYNVSTGVFTLTAGVTYDMSFTPSFITFSNTTSGYLCYEWVDATANTPLDSTGTGMGTVIPTTDTSVQNDNPTARVIYTPSTNQTVKLYVTSGNGTATLRGAIGTQAIVRPLNLSIAVQATATGTVSATVVTDTNPVLTSSNGGSSTSPGLTILTLAIPTAGTWRLDAELRVSCGTGGYVAVAFYDNGTLIPNSEYWLAGGATNNSNAGGGQYGGFMSYNLTTTGARTVTVGIWSTSSAAMITSPDGRTWARATRLDSIFALNALDTMTTTGNVSVGGNLSLTGSFQGVEPSYTFVDDSASASWWLLGTWNTVQSGQTLYMRIVSHAGYNAVASQNQVTELMWAASNGTSTYNGSSGSPMLGAGSASVNSRLGTGGVTYQSPGSFRIVQVSSTQYQVYGYFGSYTRGATYSIQTSTLCTWVHSGTAVSAPSGNYTTITPSTF
jgi:hypothetical protein